MGGETIALFKAKNRVFLSGTCKIPTVLIGLAIKSKESGNRLPFEAKAILGNSTGCEHLALQFPWAPGELQPTPQEAL